jgi:hypothetical protein
MADQKFKQEPSSFVFPVALQLPEPEPEPGTALRTKSEPWGWIELFVLSQVFWGVLLFIPGSQAYRFYIRAFPYLTSLAAVVACARSNSTSTKVPGAGWILAVLVLLVANLVHEETWFTAGCAQVVFQLAICAPVFWAARMWLPPSRLERVILLIFAANLLGSIVGLLQVYYPATFMPPEFSRLAAIMDKDFLSSLTYVGAGDRAIIRPPGLSDMPGGAAISGSFLAVIAFGLAVRENQSRLRHVIFYASVVIGMTIVYLTQIRSILLMILAGMLAVAWIRLRQGRIGQSTYIALSAAGLLVGSFVWAVTVGGDSVSQRYTGIYDTGVVQSYQDNRGIFLTYTIFQQPWEYPLGAGIGRWGMMSAYFPEPGNWQHPSLYAEIQPTGWIYDGGVLMCVFYPAALFVAMRYVYKVAIARGDPLSDSATVLFIVQLLVFGLCFTGPVFNTQIGIMFWLSTAMLYGCQKTLEVQHWAAVEAESEAAGSEDGGMVGEMGTLHT